MADDVLQMPLQYLKGVGPRKAADLKKAGLNTVEDLLFRFPRRYEDRSRLQTIISLKPGQTAAISGEVLNAGLAHTRRPGFRLFSALIQDASGQIQAVWPNQAFLKDVIRPHQRIVLFGKVEIWGSRGLQITDPEFEIIKDERRARSRRLREADTLHTGRIVPVYERTGSVTTNMQRRFVWQALEQLPPEPFDPVPADILAAAAVAVAPRRALPGAFSRQHHVDRRAQRLCHAGAAAADLRRLLRLPDRTGAAAARERAGARSRWCARWTIAFARARARCCRSS